MNNKTIDSCKYSAALARNGARSLFAALVLCGLALLSAPQTARALYLTTTNIQTGTPNGWTVNADWQTNTAAVGQGTRTTQTGNKVNLSVVAGSPTPVPCEIIGNGVAITSGAASTTVPLIRTPANSAGTTFPGGSLTVKTNTVLMYKASNNQVDYYTNLVLAGGVLNKALGGGGGMCTITGAMQVVSQSYISGGTDKNRIITPTTAPEAFIFSAALSGSGNMYIMGFLTNTANIISGGTNNLGYHGTFIVQCGSLLGTNAGSLGTNTSVIVDPKNTLYTNDMPGVAATVSNALFQAAYPYNTAGTLILTNGGRMNLNQHLAFSAVTIEGVSLSPGDHMYSELSANFPNSFVPGGSDAGSITVQNYNPRWNFGMPVINKQPDSLSLYTDGMVHFSVLADNVNTYQWLSNGVPVAGATSSTLTYGPGSAQLLAGVGYSVIMANNNGSATSSVASVTIRTPTEPYESAVAALGPYAFYQLNETTDPSTGVATAFDNANSFNGRYGVDAFNGYNSIPGPTPTTDGLPGMTDGNTAFQPAYNDNSSMVTLPALGMKTSSATFVAWINPNMGQMANACVVSCRGSAAYGALLFTGNFNATANDYSLGYNWNDDPATFSWTSGLIVPQNQWSLVAVTITPTNATVYVLNANGLASSQHVYPHPAVSFDMPTAIGGDPVLTKRIFSGNIDDVAVFNKALTADQLYGMFYAASGSSAYAPVVTASPADQTVYAGQTATFSVVGGGSTPMTYQWQVNTGSGFVNIINGGQYSGANGSVLTVNNTTAANNGYTYQVVLSNSVNVATSSSALLTVNPPAGAPLNITLSVQEGVGVSWESTGNWNDGLGGLAASVSSAQYPGSTYECLPGSRLRSLGATSHAVFPGVKLTLDGNGVFNSNVATNGLISELRLKFPVNEPTFNASITFPKLVMNGGQIDLAPDGSAYPFNYLTLGGEIDVLTNAPIYNDGTVGDNFGIYVSAFLTGAGTVEYRGDSQGSILFNNLTNNLNIACSTNTFSGTWNVVSGILLGSAANSLGTNTITVGSAAGNNAALETTYDINNPNGILFLYGKMYLHQNDTFKCVYVNGIPLQAGVYSIATLNASFPGNFPATWALQNGSTVNTASGQITVLTTPLPDITVQPQPVSVYPGQPTSFSVAALGVQPMTYQWLFNGTTVLSDSANRSGSTATVLQIAGSTAADVGNYSVVVSNIAGATTSSVAPLTMLTPGPALNFTPDYVGSNIVQGTGNDWNTTSVWNPNGRSAWLNQYANPGSTYEVPVGARVRTPADTNYNVFPGAQITIDGTGVFENNGNNNPTNVGELRFKGAAGTYVTNYFKKMVLAGGELDCGSDITVVLQGELNVQSNSSLYVDPSATIDRGYQIDSLLTGSGNLFWHETSGSLGAVNLLVTGTGNTFTGQWIVDQGALVAVGANSLGTNNIFVGTNGLTAALETLYDINSPNASLVLGANGQVFLHQNDHFASVIINGTPLASGTYSFASLNSAYPTNFPASWTQQAGSTITTGSGQITVGIVQSSSPRINSIRLNGTTLSISATNGSAGGSWILLQSTNVALPLIQWQTNATGTFDGAGNMSTNINNAGSNSQEFYMFKVQ